MGILHDRNNDSGLGCLAKIAEWFSIRSQLGLPEFDPHAAQLFWGVNSVGDFVFVDTNSR